MVLENFLIDVDVLWDRVGKELYEKPDARAGRIMRVRVVNRGVVEDLTGYTLNLGWRNAKDETKFGLDAFDVVDITKGIFELPYTSGMLSNYGVLIGTLQLMPPEGGAIESNNFVITVKRSGVDSEAIQSENSFTALEVALVQVNGWNATIGGKVEDWEADMAETKQLYIDNMNEVELTYPQELVSISQQLAQADNDYTYTLGFLNGLNDVRTRAILKVNGFYALDDGCDGKYRVLAVAGTEVWTSVLDSGSSVLFQISALGEIRAVSGTKKLKVMSKSGVQNVRMYGAKGDGTQLDTVALQRALDNGKAQLVFPEGNYKVTGTGEACLTLSKNIDLIGVKKGGCIIRSDGASATTSVLKIAITDNGGLLDVRNWRMQNIHLYNNTGGQHGLLVKGGMSLSTSEIKNCHFNGKHDNGGYGLYVYDQLSHSKITMCTIEHGAYMKCYDANVISKNMFMGTKVAITFDCVLGFYNNTVKENTIVNRDGAVHIINGRAIRIINNQIELAQGQGVSESPKRAFIWVQGVNYPSNNILIEENNMGGGTSLDHSIYIENAYRAVISKNHMIAVNIAEVVFGEDAKHCMFKQDNTVLSTPSNPRLRNSFRAEIIDNGVGTVGVLKNTSGLLNSWSGGSFFKSEDGIVTMKDAVKSGVITADSDVFQLPVGFRPKVKSTLLAYTDDGVGLLYHKFNGKLKTKNIPSNSNLMLAPFTTDIDASDSDYIVYDSFDRVNALTLGQAETDQAWATLNSNLQVKAGSASLISGTPISDVGVVDSGVSNCVVSCKFATIGTAYTKSCKLVFRYVDASNYLYVTANDISGYAYSLFSVVAGVETRIAGTTTQPYASGDVVSVNLSGDVVTCLVNGEIWTTKTVSNFSAATKHGLSIYFTQSKIDDFEVMSL